jgi:hypothetical protein
MEIEAEHPPKTMGAKLPPLFSVSYEQLFDSIQNQVESTSKQTTYKPSSLQLVAMLDHRTLGQRNLQ